MEMAQQAEWEYWVERLPDDADEAVVRLNALGAEGWELVTNDHEARLAWLKRPALKIELLP
jgi:hypothetical protein